MDFLSWGSVGVRLGFPFTQKRIYNIYVQYNIHTERTIMEREMENRCVCVDLYIMDPRIFI